MQTLIFENKDLFGEKIGVTSLISHKIENSGVIFSKPCKLSMAEHDQADKLTESMLKDGVVRTSSSPYNSPILMVTKKDGSIRFCVDYRRLNKVTKTCKYPLTNVSACYDKLHDSFYFTSLDFQSAYWSIPMAEEDKEKTAFTVRSGKYEFNVMPFGLTNAVATFCHLMDKIFAAYQWQFVLCFIDDCLIFTPKNFKLHLHHIKLVFNKIRQANLKLKLSKCLFAQPEVPFLGHIVSRQGLKMDPKKVSNIQGLQYPSTKTQVRSFLGMVGYYRSFIPDFAGISIPLFVTLKDNQPESFVISQDIKDSVDHLKHLITQYPILQYPDFSQMFYLETDASNTRIAAVLMQMKNGHKFLISAASRTLTSAEKNYGVVEREALAVVYGITYFRSYLFGKTFLVITDHKCLKYLQTFKNPNSRIVRWLLSLQDYSFEVVYRSGKQNVVADALSRLENSDNVQIFSVDIEEVQFDPSSVLKDIQGKQEADPFCSNILLYLSQNILPDDPKQACETVTWSRYMSIHNNLLYHFWTCTSDKRMSKCIKQLVVPISMQNYALKFAHCDEIGPSHYGSSKSFEKLRLHFFWRGMHTDLMRFIQKCEKCQKLKNPVGHLRIKTPYLSRPNSTKPWDVVSTDVMQLCETVSGNKWVLIIVDTFSRWIEAVALSQVNGISVSETLVHQVICRHGCPSTLICDNASYYVHGEFPRLCQSMGIRAAPVAAYHPEANGIAEAKVKALKLLLRSLVQSEHKHWDKFLPYALFAFNTSYNNQTGFTPFFINHGFEANLPGQTSMSLIAQQMDSEIKIVPHSYCAENLQNFQKCFDLVYKNLNTVQAKHTNVLNIPHYFEVGEEVWLFTPVLSIKVPKSFTEFWTGPYTVTKAISPVIVYIEHANNAKKKGYVHVSRLKKKF